MRLRWRSDGGNRATDGETVRGAADRHGAAAGENGGALEEVIEAIDILKGRVRGFEELSLELSAWMFYLGERTPSVNEGRRLAEAMITSGKALDKFRRVYRAARWRRTGYG